jgi:hypothetical protein
MRWIAAGSSRSLHDAGWEGRDVMTDTMELVPFFEREKGGLDGFPVETYVAGLRHADGTAAVEVTVSAETVERAVLTGAQFSLWLSLDGRLVLDGEGLSDDMLEAASAAGKLSEQTLVSLVSASLNPEYLAAEDDPVGDLSVLRHQLADALAQVDGALEQLKRR